MRKCRPTIDTYYSDNWKIGKRLPNPNAAHSTLVDNVMLIIEFAWDKKHLTKNTNDTQTRRPGVMWKIVPTNVRKLENNRNLGSLRTNKFKFRFRGFSRSRASTLSRPMCPRKGGRRWGTRRARRRSCCLSLRPLTSPLRPFSRPRVDGEWLLPPIKIARVNTRTHVRRSAVLHEVCLAAGKYPIYWRAGKTVIPPRSRRGNRRPDGPRRTSRRVPQTATPPPTSAPAVRLTLTSSLSSSASLIDSLMSSSWRSSASIATKLSLSPSGRARRLAAADRAKRGRT